MAAPGHRLEPDESKHAALAPLMSGSIRRVVSLKDIADEDDLLDDDDRGLDDEMMDAVMGLMASDSAAQFATLYSQWCQSKTKPLNWAEIEPLNEKVVTKFEAIPRCPNVMTLTAELLNKLVVVKLNGGLGSRMGLGGPKSALEVRTGESFLDLTVKQIEYLNTAYGADVPLILMNSFHTHDATVELIKKYKQHHIQIRCFEQSVFPRLRSDTHEPLPTKAFSMDTKQHWYPPGHGDLFYSMAACGLMEELLGMEEPKEFMFVSNVDNLGATVDLNILFHIMNANIDFAMEITEKTRADVQGGAPFTYRGQTRLMEVSQVPKPHIMEFHKKSGKRRFSHFNTNNLWISFPAVKALLETDRLVMDPIDMNSQKVSSFVQLETPVGSAIQSFERAQCILVPRTRFLPVKNTSDLLSVQSNLFQLKHGALSSNADRLYRSIIPVVKLGPEFKLVRDYHMRIPYIPDMRDLDHLTVSGDVRFGEGVVLKGTVIIVASEGSRIDIPDGSVLEDKVITGNLRILEH